MTISAVAIVQSGKVTIPVGNDLSEGKSVRVTIVDAECLVPVVDSELDVEIDEIVDMHTVPIRIENPVIRIIEAKPCLVGIED